MSAKDGFGMEMENAPRKEGPKTIKYRDVGYETAKKEVMGYFRGLGEAYPSEIEEDLELDYKLICQIVDELKREGRLTVL